MSELFSAHLRDELFLQSRLSIPVERPETVERPRVEAALDGMLDHPVTLVAAPTGFGKTTLISLWARRQRLPLAWVSLDDDLTDPRRFWAHLAQALELAVPGAGETALRELDAAPVATLPRVADLLTHGLSRQCSSLILVIDDIHILQEPAITQQLASLVDHLPPACHIVLLSRTDPPLPLARWRAKGRLLELRADDLRFTEGETSLLLRQRLGRDLAAEDVAVIAARTEGWAAGLHLAALMLRGQADQRAAIAGLHGSHRFVIDYLVEEVLNRQPPEAQAFLAQSAWLERLSGPLCDAVADRFDSQALLESLEQQNLFLIPLDGERQWYRYHYLFAECVRAWGRRRLGLDVSLLHRRAAAWWQGQGRTREAISAWLAAEAYAEALPLLARLAPDLVRRGEMGTVSRWLDPIPQRELAAFPELAIAYAWLLAFTHRFDVTEVLLRVLSDPAAPTPISPETREEIAILQKLMSALRSGQLPLGIAEHPGFQRAVAAYPFLSALAVFLGIWAGGQAAPAAGDMERANPPQEPESFPEQFSRGRRLYEQGRFQAANRLLSGALGRLTPQETPPIAALLYVVWASVLLAQNELAQSVRAADRAMELAAQLNNRHGDPMALSIKLHALRGLGRADEAAAAVITLDERRRDPRLVPWLHVTALIEELRYGLISGDVIRAAQWERELEMLIATLAEVPPFLQLSAELALMRAAWELRRADVQPRLQTAITTANTQGWAGLECEALLLWARVALADKDSPAATAAMTQALSLAVAEGALRSVLDAGPELPRLLALVGQAAERHELGLFIARVRLALGDAIPAQLTAVAPTPLPPPAAGWLAEPLSEREGEVLRLLAEGHTNRELAEHLVVAEGTIKTHLMNIYGKLGARNRTEAIARARSFGLI